VVRRRDPRLADVPEAHGLAFREELHAIEAVVGGQGVAICSDVLVADELGTGALVKAYDLPLPGFGFYVAHLPVHPRLAAIEVFSAWVRSVARR
jgi:LysR family glycine cleavage system transcriptional activator